MKLADYKGLIANMPVHEQSFPSKRKTWKKYIKVGGDIGRYFDLLFEGPGKTEISRSDLFDKAKDDNVGLFALSVIVWGYPRGMRGNHMMNIIRQFEDLLNLLNQARDNGIDNWEDHYKDVSSIRGLGLSTYTKFLYFLGTEVDGRRTLILDDRIIKTAKNRQFVELSPLSSMKAHNAVAKYPDYLDTVHDVAGRLDVNPDNLEMFLFQFGQNLKKSTSQSGNPGR